MVTVPRKTTNEIAVRSGAQSQQSISSSPATFGAATAQALQGVARDVQGAGNVASQVAEDMQRREDETRLLEYQTQLESYENESLFTSDSAVLNLKGNQAFGATQRTLGEFDSFADALEGSLTSDRQRLQAKKIRQRFKNGMARQVSRHEASQRRVWEEATRSAAIESARDRAVLYFSNPEERQASLKQIEQLVRADSAGLPPEAIQQRIEAEKTKIHASIIDRYSLDDIGGAEAYFKEHKDEMDPDSYLPIEKGFKVIRKQQQAAARKEISDQVRLVQDSYKMGIEVPESQVNALKDAAKNNGLDSQAEALDIMQNVFKDNQTFLDTPLPEQPEVLEKLRQSIAEKPTRAKLAKFQVLSESFVEKQKMLVKDPAEYYLRRKELRPFKPIDIGNPQQMKHELNQRRISLAEIENREGVRIPLFRANELDEFSKQYGTANAEQKTQILMNVKNSFTPDEARVIGQRIAPKQKSMAAVMSIVHEAPDVAERIAAGASREKFVPRSKVAMAVQEKLEGAVQDGVALEAITDSVHDLYTQLAFEKNDATKEIDETRVTEALDSIVGPKLKVKTSFFDGTPSHILPFRTNTGEFITEGDFENILGDVTLKKLIETHGDTFKLPDGTNLDVQETINRTELITVGDGVYQMRTRTGQVVVGSDGRPFNLNVKALQGGVEQRGTMERFFDSINKTTLDDYVEAQSEVDRLVSEGASQKKIEAAQQKVQSLERRERNRQIERNMTSIKYGQ